MDLGTRGPTPKENPVLIKCVPTPVSMAPLLAVKAQTGRLGQEHPVPAALLPLGRWGGGWAVLTSSVAPVLHQQARPETMLDIPAEVRSPCSRAGGTQIWRI